MPIVVKDLDKVIKGLDFEKSVDKLTQDILVTLSKMLIRMIKDKAPKKSGEYAESWVIQNTSAKSVTVGTPKTKLHVFLEYGTAAHPITPKKASVLRWEDESGVHFAMYVSHTGFPAKPHVRPALKRWEKQVPDVIAGKVKKHWKIVK